MIFAALRPRADDYAALQPYIMERRGRYSEWDDKPGRGFFSAHMMDVRYVFTKHVPKPVVDRFIDDLARKRKWVKMPTWASQSYAPPGSSGHDDHLTIFYYDDVHDGLANVNFVDMHMMSWWDKLRVLVSHGGHVPYRKA